jgi:UDP-MurNAc hydroxylase
VRITSIGHAGLLVETSGGTVVCDPWFNPAFLDAWFPFPRNDRLSDDVMEAIATCDLLYVSHSHKDHYDAEFLAEHVNHDARVLLPDFSIPLLRRELTAVGFHDFVTCPDRTWVDLGGGLEAAIIALDAPNVGPMGDSSLLLQDPSARLLNQNDAHPSNLDLAAEGRGTDVHLLQHSGAIWFPMVYDLPEDQKADLVTAKRERQLDRATSYVEMVGAPTVVPMAGPPCFLDEELFGFNDLPGNPTIFPDAVWFEQHMAERGHDEVVVTVPGSMLEVDGTTVSVTHPGGEAAVRALFEDKEAVLRAYQADTAQLRADRRRLWADAPADPLLPALRDWLEPLLSEAAHTRSGVGAAIGVVAGDERVLLDLPAGRVRAWEDADDPPYWFRIPREVVATAVRDRLPDWVNTVFLSCRFQAHRDGPYNEFLYTFFKSLSADRMAYCEQWYAANTGAGNRPLEWVEVDGWVVEKRCPHQGAFLDRVGSVEGTTLTCGLHGWQFDVETGHCTSSEGVEGTDLRVRGRADRMAEPSGSAAK